MIEYRIGGDLSSEKLNGLYFECWPGEHVAQSYANVLERSLLFVTAYDKEKLVGFVNLAWDGGQHAFLLDTTVDPRYRRRGVGTELCKRAIEAARTRNIRWMHVDFKPHLRAFYENCGFRPTEAGLIRLRK